MTLRDLIQEIQYDSSWGIWAETPFTPHSVARYGQTQFRNGGLLDDMQFFADGVECGNAIERWLEDIPYSEREDWMAAEAAEEFISQVEAERLAEM